VAPAEAAQSRNVITVATRARKTLKLTPLKPLLLVGLLLGSFIGLPSAVYCQSESEFSIRYFARGRVTAATRDSVDVEGQVSVLFKADDRWRAEQVASIRKHFGAARRILVQVGDEDERYEAKVVQYPDDHLNMSLRLNSKHRQFSQGETLELEIFLYGP
jgi:hypothetical protein